MKSGHAGKEKKKKKKVWIPLGNPVGGVTSCECFCSHRLRFRAPGWARLDQAGPDCRGWLCSVPPRDEAPLHPPVCPASCCGSLSPSGFQPLLILKSRREEYPKDRDVSLGLKCRLRTGEKGDLEERLEK